MTFLATAINSELSVGIKSFDLFYIKCNSEDGMVWLLLTF